MKISIGVEDLRLARYTDLERLTGIPGSSFAHWSSGRSMAEKSVTRIAESLRMSEEEVRSAFKLRRQDYKSEQMVNAKFEQFGIEEIAAA